MVSGASAAIRSAHASPSATPPTFWTKPKPAAASPEYVSAASSMARAGPGPGQAQQALHRPLVDHQAELGRRDAERRVGRGDAEVAGDRELGAGTERRALDRGEGGQGQIAQREQEVVEPGHELRVLDAAEVGPGTEVAAGAGEHEHPRGAVGLRPARPRPGPRRAAPRGSRG